MGKAIYQPKGAAAEYAKYACNFYIGCSNECSYCYCKRWKWGNVPILKKCFKDEKHALEVFEKELNANLSELQKHGLFFSFTTDPMLKETESVTAKALFFAITMYLRRKSSELSANISSLFFLMSCSNVLCTTSSAI